MDGAGRARPRRPADRHRRGGVRPLAVARSRTSAWRPRRLPRRAVIRRRPTQPLVDDVAQALYASKIVAYAQGFDQMAAAAEHEGWDLDLGAIATIWRGGCIIRARFLDRIREAYADEPDLHEPAGRPTSSPTRSADGAGPPGAACRGARPADRASRRRRSPPSLAYYDGYRRATGPAGLIQAQRDLFGAHTYQRVDRDGTLPHRLERRRQGVRGLTEVSRPPRPPCAAPSAPRRRSPRTSGTAGSCRAARRAARARGSPASPAAATRPPRARARRRRSAAHRR